jgi:16S rRNA C967 or C1407 C5-methylase (RsmB/RsmF family)
VPNGSGEKAKGAILSRAVQYIHHLKENEARNIEKWTLEKLLMDQAVGDLQTQVEELRRHWEEERLARQRAEAELEGLKGMKQGNNPTAAPVSSRSRSPDDSGAKRRTADDEEKAAGKRQRVD